jgi:hypothetical protein
VLQIGIRGEFDGHTWEIIGVVLRQAAEYDYFWEEYLLFNPWQGFRFLVNNHGHWSLVKMLVDHPENVSHSGLNYEGKPYKHYTTGDARIAAVLGEFYWKVHYGDVAKTSDFVAPPHMLSVEVEDGGMIWSQGTYLAPELVRKAFNFEGEMPRPYTVGMNQPNPYKSPSLWMGIAGAIALVIAIVLQFSQFSKSSNQSVFSAEVVRDSLTDTLVSQPFTIPGESGNVEVTMKAPNLFNSWLEIDGYLHNMETLEDYGVNIGLEYYVGVEDGESWSEGNQSGAHFLNLVPGGKYELVLSIAGDSLIPMTLDVRRDVPFFTNLLIVLGLIIILPIIYFVLYRTFEHSRWAEAG